MPDSPEAVASELRALARLNTADLDGFKPEATIEWDAANKLESAVRALRDISSGASDPKAAATVALLAMGSFVLVERKR